MSCKYCDRKPIVDDVLGYESYLNSETLSFGTWTTLNIGVDETGKLIMYGKGDDETDFYYPKYCPECGTKRDILQYLENQIGKE